MSEKIVVTIRLPKELKDEIEQMADANVRSLSGQIVFILERYLGYQNLPKNLKQEVEFFLNNQFEEV